MPPRTPAPRYSLKFGVSDRTASPICGDGRAGRPASRRAAGPRTRRTRAGRARAPAPRPRGTGTAPRRPPCRAGRSATTSKPPASAGGQRLAQVVLDQVDADPAAGRLLADPGQHVGVGVDHGQPADHLGVPGPGGERPRWPARSGRRRRAAGSAARPGRARRACRSTRRSLVATVQCVWSSSGLASGPPSAACSSSASSGATASGITTPRPAQAGQVASRSGWPRRHRRAALGGQPHRAGAIDDAALAQLVADRRDDGHGQLGQPG